MPLPSQDAKPRPISVCKTCGVPLQYRWSSISTIVAVSGFVVLLFSGGWWIILLPVFLGVAFGFREQICASCEQREREAARAVIQAEAWARWEKEREEAAKQRCPHAYYVNGGKCKLGVSLDQHMVEAWCNNGYLVCSRFRRNVEDATEK